MSRQKQDRIATGLQPSKTVRWLVGLGVGILLIIGLGLLGLQAWMISTQAGHA